MVAATRGKHLPDVKARDRRPRELGCGGDQREEELLQRASVAIQQLPHLCCWYHEAPLERAFVLLKSLHRRRTLVRCDSCGAGHDEVASVRAKCAHVRLTPEQSHYKRACSRKCVWHSGALIRALGFKVR
jgi:hypothetical protein